MSKYLSLILAGIALCASAVWADTVELPLTDDAFINGTKPDLNAGTWERIVVHTYGPKHGLVRFDAASMAGQEVSQATLTLYLNSLASNGTISVHAITSGWNEATVTWNNQPPAETMATAIVELTTGDVGSLVAIDVTSAVQRWADGSLTDAGFLIVTSEDIRAKFDAKEMAGGVPATLMVVTGEPAYSGEAIVLDLSPDQPCLIDEPGHYILDRDWASLPTCLYKDDPYGERFTLLAIDADNVLLDLNGYGLNAGAQDATTLIINGSKVTVRNGGLGGNYALEGGGENNRYERLTGSHFIIAGSGGHLIDSRTNAVIVGAENFLLHNVQIRYRAFDDYWPENCITIYSSATNTVVRNVHVTCQTLEAPSIFIGGAGSIVEGSVFLLEEPDWGLATGLEIAANGVKVLRNILLSDGSESGTGINVSGTGNVIDGNLVMPGGYQVGVSVPGAGNFLGNNRVSAATPYLNIGDDTDWGGNVSF